MLCKDLKYSMLRENQNNEYAYFDEFVVAVFHTRIHLYNLYDKFYYFSENKIIKGWL